MMMRKNPFIFFASTIPTLFFFGCTHRPMDGAMMGWDHMLDYGGYGGMLMWMILIIVLGVIIYFVFERSRKADNPRDSAGENAVDILNRRYAKGEITKEEFERIKRDIES